MSNSSPFHIGTARREMTPYVPGIGMMGFAMHFHVVHDVDMPIFARAMVFRTGEQKLAIVHADIAFITLYIRKRVLQVLDDKHSALGYTEHNLMLTATHTHSAPGGYSEYGLYNIQIAGFNQAVAETYVNGIVEALVAADANQHPANLRVGKSTFAEDTPVAFNRAWEAYSANDDTEDIDHANRHLAVDREMVQLSAHREDGTALGVVNWFAVHTTSAHNDKRAISTDNKGWAAAKQENAQHKAGNDDFIALYSQAATGDVTPNFQRFPGRKETRGVSRDDYEALRINGEFQQDLSDKILKQDTSGDDYEPPVLDSIQAYVDMTDIHCDPEFARNNKNAKTGKALLGVGFMEGTREGEGVHGLIPYLATQISKSRKLAAPMRHGPKVPVINCTDRLLLGDAFGKTIIPGFIAPDVKVMKQWANNDAFAPQPLSPNILPVQIFIIGTLAIAALPTEPTTVVGRRIRATLQDVLADRGVKHVVVKGYANAYSGYTTTYEEYQLQGYEAASTHFGQWTCAAYRTVLRDLALELCKKPSERTPYTDLRPHTFTERDLAKRQYIPKKKFDYAKTPQPIQWREGASWHLLDGEQL